MRRAFAVLFVVPLMFAMLPLGAVLMGGGTAAPEGTLVLETAEGQGTPSAVAWDAHEFQQRDDALAFRSADGQGGAGDPCAEIPQG